MTKSKIGVGGRAPTLSYVVYLGKINQPKSFLLDEALHE